MYALLKRHLLIYVKNKGTVFFSVLGALIALSLYLLFMKNNLASSFEQLPDGIWLSHLWLIGGSLGTTAITTSLVGVGQLVTDRERQVFKDFLLTDTSRGKIYLSYYLSGAIIGVIMQVVVFSVMWGIFYLQDGLTIPLSDFVSLFLSMVFVSLVLSLGNLLVVYGLSKDSTLGQISTLMGTLAGFASMTYMPLGILPKLAQQVFKLTPAVYVSSLYRQLLMAEQLQDTPAKIREFLGVGLSFGRDLTTFWQDMAAIGVWGGVFSLVFVLLVKTVKHH